MKAKNMLKHFQAFVFQIIAFSLLLIVHAQAQNPSQLGFISLDCGRLPRNESYTELTTGIDYVSDEAFIDTGESKSVAPEFKSGIQEQAKFVRTFPEGTRNCYRVNVTKNTKYLIRTLFMYGNYDGLNQLPVFDIYLGVTFWDTVKLVSSDASNPKEVVHVVTQDFVHVCLVNTGSGTPFISALELRPLRNDSYVTTSGSLRLIYRVDTGATLNDSGTMYRYPVDVFDRIWLPFTNTDYWTRIKAPVNVTPEKTYNVPSQVLSTAALPIDPNSPLLLSVWSDTDLSAEYFVYMYFAELQQLKANESRGFNIIFQGERLYGPLIPRYLNTTSIYTQRGLTGGNFTFSFVKLENSTLPPLLNAFEIYKWVSFSQSETDQNDLDAMMNIKLSYGVKRNWEADPCLPLDFLWTGLNCSYSDLDPPRITSLNLSSSGLIGEISPFISNLTLILSLDLSNNSLSGSVPDFLSQMPNLKNLNLESNKFTGSIPAELIRKSQSGLLSLSFGDNPNLNCSELSCANTVDKNNKKNNIVVPIIASIGGLIFLLITGGVIFAIVKSKKIPAYINDPLASKKRPFTYAEIVKITNNFEKALGKGGFGTVYLGLIDENTKVAVKLLARPPPSVRRNPSEEEEDESMRKFYQEQFEAEVTLLMRVHHGNLLSLVGYCNEEDNKALIYEFMANGDLDSHILGNKNTTVLSWEERLHIALDSAQGLEYMHNGCKPQIIHRDVKCTNILLNERFQAKIADFGLSKAFSDENATHVSTKVAGTRGYLDPEYYTTNWLNEKSDVFSFGVVLLEIITGRPAISRSGEGTHVIQWVESMLSNGDIQSIVEPKLYGDFDTNSVWKAVELAMACSSRAPTKRPTMSQVVTELKECLATELARRNVNRTTESTVRSDEFVSVHASPTEISPLAR